MRRLLQNITARFVLSVNVLVVLLFLAACLSTYLDPIKWWFTGFLSLIFPYLAMGLIFFLIFWLFMKPAWSSISVLALVIGYVNMRMLIPFQMPSAFKDVKKEDCLRVMTWNIRYFTPFRKLYYDQDLETQHNAILREIKRYMPDVICFQEFTNAAGNEGRDPSLVLREELGYKYSFFPGDDINWNTVASGTAIFSRYPIIRAELIRYPRGMFRDVEHTAMADIRYRGDTIRVYSMHLQSFGFLPNDYDTFSRLKNQQDTRFSASKNLLKKMKETFMFHGFQADFIKKRVDSSPHPEIICIDLNDVPASYAYTKLRGDRNDVHTDKGWGFGKTYTSPSSPLMGKLPTLRIDYIFTDPSFETLQVTRGPGRLSDHQAVVADIRLAEKE